MNIIYYAGIGLSELESTQFFSIVNTYKDNGHSCISTFGMDQTEFELAFKECDRVLFCTMSQINVKTLYMWTALALRLNKEVHILGLQNDFISALTCTGAAHLIDVKYFPSPANYKARIFFGCEQ